MPIGVIACCIAVLVGGLVGCAVGKALPESLKSALNGAFGLCALVMGIYLVTGVVNLSAVVLAFLVGTVIGTLLHLETHVTNGVAALGKKFLKGQTMAPEKMDALIAVIVLILTSTAGIFGAINEGLTGDHTILLAKAVLDFFTALIFAADIGLFVPLVCIPEAVLLLVLYGASGALSSFLTDSMMLDFKACGGILILSVAMRLLHVGKFRPLDFLPALILVLPLSAGWTALWG